MSNKLKGFLKQNIITPQDMLYTINARLITIKCAEKIYLVIMFKNKCFLLFFSVAEYYRVVVFKNKLINYKHQTL
jgi:hypothetical protein